MAGGEAVHAVCVDDVVGLGFLVAVVDECGGGGVDCVGGGVCCAAGDGVNEVPVGWGGEPSGVLGVGCELLVGVCGCVHGRA